MREDHVPFLQFDNIALNMVLRLGFLLHAYVHMPLVFAAAIAHLCGYSLMRQLFADALWYSGCVGLMLLVTLLSLTLLRI